jgi:glycosyltransferase involved in cell wall biosynthesis
VSADAIRVLYVSPVAERGGAETVLLNILKFHDRSRFEPCVCLLKKGPLVAEVEALGVRTSVIETGRLRDVRRTLDTVRRIRQVVRTQQIDLVFGNMAMGHVYGGLAAVGTGARAVWFQHGLPAVTDPLAWLSALVPSAKIFVNSQATASAQAKLPGCAGRLQLVDLAVDTARFTPSTRLDRPLLRALGVAPDGPVVAMIARFQRWKGQDVFLQAAARVAQKRPDVRFVLVGDAMFGLERGFPEELRALVAELNLADRVTFAGFRDDVPALLDEVDVVVHPHRAPEPFGLAIVEALLMEKAVVASNIGAPIEFITNGSTGVLVPPDDPEAVAHSILTLAGDRELRVALGRAGRAAMLRRFTMEQMIGNLEASFCRVVRAAGGVGAGCESLS